VGGEEETLSSFLIALPPQPRTNVPFLPLPLLLSSLFSTFMTNLVLEKKQKRKLFSFGRPNGARCDAKLRLFI